MTQRQVWENEDRAWFHSQLAATNKGRSDDEDTFYSRPLVSQKDKFYRGGSLVTRKPKP